MAWTDTLGKAVKSAVYHTTTGGVDHLAHSVGLRETAFKATEDLSRGGTIARALFAPPLIVLNAASHGAALGVRGTKALGKGYVGAWKAHPGKMAAGTAIIGVPVAYSMMKSDGKGESREAAARIAEVETAQTETGQALGMLQQVEPPARPYSSLQEASPQVMAATVASQGNLRGAPAQGQSIAG